ncbi:MAG: ATP-binding protein [Armatimonadota bacterium]|nr:ATP-binding protein [Armatimonadota bacterium]
MDTPSLVLLLTSVVHLLVGLFVFVKNPRSVVHRALLLESALFSFWALTGFIIWCPALHSDPLFWGRVAHAASLFVSAGFVVLGLVFPDGRTQTPLGLRWGVWVAGFIIAARVVFTPDLVVSAQLRQGHLQAEYGPLRGPYFLYIALCVLWGLGDLASRYRRSQGHRRVQIQYLLAGLVLSALLNIPTNVLGPLLFQQHSSAWAGPVLTLAFVGMVAHAIVRHRLMGIRLLVGRSVAYGIALTGVGLAFAAIYLVARLAWGTNQPPSTVLGGVALLIAVFFQPFYSRVHDAVLGYFYRPPYDYQQTVRVASRTLAALMDLNRVVSYLLEMVQSTLQVERALVLLHRAGARGYVVHAVRGAWNEQEDEAGLEGAVLPDDSVLVKHLEAVREAVIGDELEMVLGQQYDPRATEEMRFFGAQVAVPFLSGGAILGMLLLGEKLSGDVFSPQDLDLLNTLGSEAATAIANARLLEEAMQQERLVTLGTLSAGIAHEIKNPLVALRTFAELLPESYDDPEFRFQFAPVVLEQVQQIVGLIDRLLDYARPRPLVVAPADLNQLLEETLQLLSYQIAQHEVAVERAYHPSLPPAMVDAGQFRQVVLNITLNALQVMPKGGFLRVTTRMAGAPPEPLARTFRAAPAPAVEMEIANSGTTIPPELRERIFEPFFSQRSGGTGLGLSICRRIVTEHQGSIRATTTDDGLTAFVVRVPAAVAPAVEAAIAETRPAAHQTKTAAALE